MLLRLLPVLAVIACSVFAAKAVAALTEAGIDEPKPASGPAPVKVVAAPVSTPDGAELVKRNMFCSTCEPIEIGPIGTFKPEAILIATSIGVDPRATLRVPASEAQGSWGVGDRVPGVGRIERIGFTSVDISDGDRFGTLTLFDGIPGGRKVTDAATSAPAAADPFADRYKKIDDTTFEVDRSLVRELVGGNVKAAGARISPIEKNGQLQGLRLFGVRGDGVAGRIGLKNGDVLQAINSQQIESANTLIELYSRLDQLNVVQLEGTRAGKPLTLTLRLR